MCLRKPVIGSVVTFVAPDGNLFVGKVVRDCGWTVLVDDSVHHLVPLESGTEWTPAVAA